MTAGASQQTQQTLGTLAKLPPVDITMPKPSSDTASAQMAFIIGTAMAPLSESEREDYWKWVLGKFTHHCRKRGLAQEEIDMHVQCMIVAVARVVVQLERSGNQSGSA